MVNFLFCLEFMKYTSDRLLTRPLTNIARYTLLPVFWEEFCVEFRIGGSKPSSLKSNSRQCSRPTVCLTSRACFTMALQWPSKVLGNKRCYVRNVPFHSLMPYSAKHKKGSTAQQNHIYGLMQNRRNSIANALGLRLFCIKPLICNAFFTNTF